MFATSEAIGGEREREIRGKNKSSNAHLVKTILSVLNCAKLRLKVEEYDDSDTLPENLWFVSKHSKDHLNIC